MTPLNVPFREKDQAKALGARWNPQQRHWFVPAGLALEPFRRWLPPGDPAPEVPPSPATTAAEAPTSPPPSDDEAPGFSLSALLQRLGVAVAEACPTPLWVRAELVEVRTRGRHQFLEIAEHNADGQLLAQAEAALWQGRRERIDQTFRAATGHPLQGGIKLLLQVEVDFPPTWGKLRLTVTDVDPRYTLGDMAAKRQAIRRTLVAEGCFDRNRRLEAPGEFCRVAVISPAQAAGLGDFERDADALEAVGLVKFHYFTALFEGPRAVESLLAALGRAVDHHGHHALDAVVIIRGGGAVAGLNWLNDEALARAVCHCPVPVLSGIGHQKDDTAVDEVAHQPFGTPSKVAAHIRETAVGNAQGARAAWAAIQAGAHTRTRRAKARVDRDWNRTLERVLRLKAQAAETLERDYRDLETAALRRCHRAEAALHDHRQRMIRTGQQNLYAAHTTCHHHRGALAAGAHYRLRTAQRNTGLQHLALGGIKGILKRARLALQALGSEVTGHRPRHILRRGFAVVRAGKTPVTSRQAAKSHRRLELEFHDGTVAVTRTRSHSPPEDAP